MEIQVPPNQLLRLFNVLELQKKVQDAEIEQLIQAVDVTYINFNL
jgi:hypothetical protein